VLCDYAGVVADPAEPTQDERVRIAAGNLRVDAATAEVTRALDAAAIPSIVLKGPTIARWLYGRSDPRGYSDSDLLVAPEQVAAAEAVLTDLGYARRYDIEGLPDWWLEHAHEWWRERDGVWVDLHDALPGVGLDNGAAWSLLAERTEAFEIAGQPARALAADARALHIALHVAHHGEGWGKALRDLDRAVAAVDDDTWRAAGGLAEQLEATDAFGTGLRLSPAGAELADRLRLPANRSVDAALRAGRPAPMALGFEQLAAAGGMRVRAKMVARKLVPPPGFMRHWYPPAQHSRRQLAFAYIYRPFWMLRNALPGWRAWRRERHRVKNVAD
jgi:Uncharacterised nucleotidyltransferase